MRKMKTMKTIGLMAIFTLFLSATVVAQDKSDRPSPPMTAQGMVRGTMVTIDYSAPEVKGRTLWGSLVPYGKVWRTGANEATTISVDKDVMIAGNELKAGKYALFTIPGEKEWEIIINSVWDQWGAYNYDPASDVFRFKVKPLDSDVAAERLVFTVDEGGLVVMRWGDLKVSFTVQSAK